MDTNFWHRRWQNNQIAFHQQHIHPLLIKHFHQLCLADHARVFVPLCGKTQDISWLLHQGYHVCAIELSEIAITQLFNDLSLDYQKTKIGDFQHYQADQIDVFVGDFFNFDIQYIGKIDAVYDRAALVALPDSMRKDYVQHLFYLTHAAPQLVINYDYPQELYTGPPFSITDSELSQLYKKYSSIQLLEQQQPMQDALLQKFPSQHVIFEKIWKIF